MFLQEIYENFQHNQNLKSYRDEQDFLLVKSYQDLIYSLNYDISILSFSRNQKNSVVSSWIIAETIREIYDDDKISYLAFTKAFETYQSNSEICDELGIEINFRDIFEVSYNVVYNELHISEDRRKNIDDILEGFENLDIPNNKNIKNHILNRLISIYNLTSIIF